jgi:hypothetical protein
VRGQVAGSGSAHGEEGGEAVPVDVVERLLGAGMQRLAAHEQAGAVGVAGQVDPSAGLGDRRAVAGLAVLPGGGRLGVLA